jgi:hypothetical protein
MSGPNVDIPTDSERCDESVYSMDSFLADLPPEDGEILEEEADRDARGFISYFSPSSGTDASLSDVSRSQPLPPAQDTIDTAAKQQAPIDRKPAHVRQISTDGSESLPPIKPVHPFFSSRDESDLSDGSLVFTNTEVPGYSSTPVIVTSEKKEPSRDRFPSFDSVGSSGSIRYVSPNRQAHPVQRQLHSQENPLILPYHERRKLVQQRRQQRQQAPAPRPVDRAGMPYMFQSSYPGELPMGMGFQPYGGMPMPPPNYSMHASSPNGPMGMPPTSGPMDMLPRNYPIHPPPPNGPMGMSPSGPWEMTNPNYPMHSLPPNGPIGMYHQYIVQPPFPHPGYNPFHFQPALQTAPNEHPEKVASNSRRPPVAHKPPSPSPKGQPMSQQQQNTPRARPPMPAFRDTNPSMTSSFDSSEGIEEREIRLKDVPPPPPPAAKPGHVRQESTGSVSSLGSMDRSSGQDDMSRSRRQGSRGAALFKRLNLWGQPPVKQQPPTVNDFHRKNQAFLSTVPRPATANSPIQAHRWVPVI